MLAIVSRAWPHWFATDQMNKYIDLNDLPSYKESSGICENTFDDDFDAW